MAIVKALEAYAAARKSGNKAAIRKALTLIALSLIMILPLGLALVAPAAAQTATPDPNASYNVDLTPVGDMLDELGNIIPNLVNLAIRMVPAIILFGVLAFVFKFLDKFLVLFDRLF